MDMKVEVVVLPVSDVDRAKRFYEKLGVRLDIDYVGLAYFSRFGGVDHLTGPSAAS